MCVLVGKKAPDFTAAAVLKNNEIVEKFTLSEVISKKYGLLFFYPMDFTFVCPTELIALHNKIAEFTKRGVEVIGISNDSQFVHLAWRNTDVKSGGIGQLDYTLVADFDHSITRNYGVEYPDPAVPLRAAFLIDKDGVVRSQIVNDLPLGRNISELVRLFDAIQYHEKNGEVCPAGWQNGDAGFAATPNGVANYLKDNATKL